MMEMAQSLESYSGRGWKENDIAKMLTDLYAKKIKDAGHVSLVAPLGSREHLHIRELRSEGHGIRDDIDIHGNEVTKPNLIEGKLPFDLSESCAEEDAELNVETVLLTEDENILPSELLSNQ